MSSTRRTAKNGQDKIPAIPKLTARQGPFEETRPKASQTTINNRMLAQLPVPTKSVTPKRSKAPVMATGASQGSSMRYQTPSMISATSQPLSAKAGTSYTSPISIKSEVTTPYFALPFVTSNAGTESGAERGTSTRDVSQGSTRAASSKGSSQGLKRKRSSEEHGECPARLSLVNPNKPKARKTNQSRPAAGGATRLIRLAHPRKALLDVLDLSRDKTNSRG